MMNGKCERCPDYTIVSPKSTNFKYDGDFGTECIRPNCGGRAIVTVDGKCNPCGNN